MTSLATHTHQTVPTWRRRPYPPITLGAIAIVVAAFWRTYFGPLLRNGAVDLPPLIHVHAAVFVGWLVLLLTQVMLAATGRVRLHRQVGQAGIYYGALVWVMGMVVTFSVPVNRIHAGEWDLSLAVGILIRTLGSMILFAGFFTAAIRYRQQPEVHKRLMLAATLALSFAAVGRITESHGWFLLIWLSPMLAVIGFEFYSRRRVHPVTMLSTTILLVAYGRVLLRDTDAWQQIGRAILRPLL